MHNGKEMSEMFDIEKWFRENEERINRISEMLKANPMCEECPQWNPFFGCDMCREDSERR